MSDKNCTQRYLLKKKRKRKEWTLSPLAFSCMLAVIILTTGVTYSRYESMISGEDSAQVAKFDVTAEGDAGQTISLSEENPEGTYSFKVNADMEVGWEYDLIVIQTDGARLPEGVSLEVTRTDKSVQVVRPMTETTQFKDADYAYQLKQADIVEVGSYSAEYDLIFTADFSTLTDSVEIEELQISIVATQID